MTREPLKLEAMRRAAPKMDVSSSVGDIAAHEKVSAIPAVVVGVDIREYTADTSSDEQYVMSRLIYEALEKAIDALLRLGYGIEQKPVIVQRTGDGALIVFDCWECPFSALCNASGTEPNPHRPHRLCSALRSSDNRETSNRRDTSNMGADESSGGRSSSGDGNTTREKDAENSKEESSSEVDRLLKCGSKPQCQARLDAAFSFLFSLNVLIWHRSRVYVQNNKLHRRVRPRFAMSRGKIYLLSGHQGELDCVGSALVDCSRLLSIDHGAHFLLQQELLDFLDHTRGGTGSLCGGLWEHVFHVDESPTKKIKYGEHRYANIFGDHSDRPLLRALHRFNVRERTFRIGTHDSQTIS